ncbi:MAG: putative integral membrane proteinase [uncultured bacterium]|nr:MAG: putative integral membrane proteinase [uncultured bacterium]OFW69869.1 MAG: HflK protein [Alphaproteobacteria bacterium GWC2_42_16]OFW73080.1 MAG: HflK protein [Alphaproteobacteria bacterium GWA2_41_27]OFW81654.1 MAG: HflK protein [Alphaproteobacteria bacterium RIFCSPHIGHO2_12_FULL_42_100]OFW85296.1 MAG: HflK protein [Alphaproteobacteria bacterium RBG_16_42_14]OFW90554.1 MAG: HflK protein [Alphaproteobacteria bacterium RIFCSPHIGHO2_02_FULL_42_30]OFW93395.1 MAG: HflK protein [Alphaprot
MSFNDDDDGPWGQGNDDPWKKKPRQRNSVPDIEVFIKKGRDRFKKFFPKNGKINNRPLWYAAGGIFVLWLLTGIYTVQQDEQAAILRFGKWIRTTDPGLNYHLPTPIESALVRNVTAINVLTNTNTNPSDSGDLGGEGALMLTGDENIADVQFAVNWRIKDLGDFLFNVNSPETTIRAAADSIVRSVISQTPIAQILSEGRSQINIKLKEMLQKLLDEYKLGVEVTQVELLKVTPPTAKVMDAYLDVQRAKADMERKRNEAEYYRNSIIPVARGQAKKILQDAEGYKKEVMAGIDGETSRFDLVYNQYRTAPDITRNRLYLDTMQHILEPAQKLIVDGEKNQGVLPYLPLPELKQKPEKTEASS